MKLITIAGVTILFAIGIVSQPDQKKQATPTTAPEFKQPELADEEIDKKARELGAEFLK